MRQRLNSQIAPQAAPRTILDFLLLATPRGIIEVLGYNKQHSTLLQYWHVIARTGAVEALNEPVLVESTASLQSSPSALRLQLLFGPTAVHNSGHAFFQRLNLSYTGNIISPFCCTKNCG